MARSNSETAAEILRRAKGGSSVSRQEKRRFTAKIFRKVGRGKQPQGYNETVGN